MIRKRLPPSPSALIPKPLNCSEHLCGGEAIRARPQPGDDLPSSIVSFRNRQQDNIIWSTRQGSFCRASSSFYDSTTTTKAAARRRQPKPPELPEPQHEHSKDSCGFCINAAAPDALTVT